MPSHTAHVEGALDGRGIQGHEEQAIAAGAGAGAGVSSPSQERTQTKFKVAFPKVSDDPEQAKQQEELNDEQRRLIRQRLHEINDRIDDNQVWRSVAWRHVMSSDSC